MAFVLKRKIARRNNYGDKRSLEQIRFIVVHYTGNDGDSDEANANYFANGIRNASAHYFVDGDSVTQSVPDNFVAWHCGTKKKYYHPTCRNSNSIGVELCDEKRNGVYDFSEKTLQNADELIKKLMKQYDVPIENVIRHYDVTHKVCPAPFVNNQSAWNEFKARLVDKTVSVNTNTGTENQFKVKVITGNLNIRKGPGTTHAKTGVITNKGTYTIVETVGTPGKSGSWGKLKSGAGWISLYSGYVKKIG